MDGRQTVTLHLPLEEHPA